MTHGSGGTVSDHVLNHDIVTGKGEPRAWLYVLHGIFGAGRNWATIARRITAARPGWGALLIDLRQHGGSQGFPGPHTIAAAAADLDRLGEVTGMPASAVLGHSFGGKVALEFAAAGTVRQVWVVDSTPQAGPPGGSAWHMLGVLQSLPESFATRDEAIQSLQDNGVAAPVAQWMATNLERADGGFRWRFDLAALAELLRDFFRKDLWPVVEQPPPDADLHFVKASESSVLSGEPLRRLEEIVRNDAQVWLHPLEGGHWLNADNPDGVTSLVVDALPDVT